MSVCLNYQRLVCFRIKLWKRRKHLLAKDNRHVFQTRGRDTGPLQNLNISKNGNTGKSQHHGSHLLIGKISFKREYTVYPINTHYIRGNGLSGVDVVPSQGFSHHFPYDPRVFPCGGQDGQLFLGG